MKAAVFHGIGDIRLDDVPEPRIEEPDDAVIRITCSAICGTDLHMIRGTMPGMKPGTVLGHEAVGVVEEVGSRVRNLVRGDRVVVPSTIACGQCTYCRDGYYAQCDEANPNGKLAGTAFFGGPEPTGPFNGLQAEYARIPFAATGLVKLPDEVSDDDAILVSDVAPTGWFGADMAGIKPGKTVAVFGCRPVGLFAIAAAQHMNAGRVLAIDTVSSRLEMARRQGAEVIDFNADDPVAAVRELTLGAGADCVIDAVGVDAEPATGGPAAASGEEAERQQRERDQVAPEKGSDGKLWRPGGAPSQAAEWSVNAVAKAGTVSLIGVYPPQVTSFRLGVAMQRNLTLRMGNCNHRRYIPDLVSRVRSGALRPQTVLTQTEPLPDAIAAYEAFDQRESGWVKVGLLT